MAVRNGDVMAGEPEHLGDAVAHEPGADDGNARLGHRIAPPVSQLDGGSAANSSPPPCGEGSGVGVEDWGTAGPQLPDPPPQPSPTRGEGVAAGGRVHSGGGLVNASPHPAVYPPSPVRMY